MKKYCWGWIAIFAVCAFLTISAFFANNFELYRFHMAPSDYDILERDERPPQANTALWFSYGGGRELYYGAETDIPAESIQFYEMRMDGSVQSVPWGTPISAEAKGYFIAALPVRIANTGETIYDFARADLGPHAYAAVPRGFHIEEIPFELAFEERKKIQVFFEGNPLSDIQVLVTTVDFETQPFTTDGNGYIKNLPVRYIRDGLTVSYAPEPGTLYRMYYALEDYDYFSAHFWKAQIPLLLILALTAVGIVVVCLIRWAIQRKSPEYQIYSRERAGLYASPLRKKTSSHFLLIRWLFLMGGFFLWTWAGKLAEQGQVLNQIAVPVFSCPFNLDQTLESSCYYLSHLPELFTIRSVSYITAYLGTLLVFLILFGRILCGFMCPLGFVQDLMDKLRQFLHIRPIVVTDRMNRVLQPLKWTWIILFLCFTFTGGNFCDVCPNKIFSPALGGYWIDLVLGGVLTIPLLVGSFFIKRFWCIMCPMGYLLGIFYKFNLFKLKKDCTACTECRACYAACPMRLKNIYTERETENVQTVDCLMCGECVYQCPEDGALHLTFCGKTIYSASKKTFLSKFRSKEGAKRD